MCNLYRLSAPLDAIRALFGAADDTARANLASEIFPGYPGVVIADGALRPMTWGFPLALTGKHGQQLKPRPVNNARTDKLAGAFWRASIASRRCLIPLTAWAEAEGAKGAKTRTWLSLPDQPIFAAAGIWRPTAEWGDAYAMVMTDAAGAAAQVHTRMPVILSPADLDIWLNAPPDAATRLCTPYRGAISLDPTDTLWSGQR